MPSLHSSHAAMPALRYVPTPHTSHSPSCFMPSPRVLRPGGHSAHASSKLGAPTTPVPKKEGLQRLQAAAFSEMENEASEHSSHFRSVLKSPGEVWKVPAGQVLRGAHDLPKKLLDPCHVDPVQLVQVGLAVEVPGERTRVPAPQPVWASHFVWVWDVEVCRVPPGQPVQARFTVLDGVTRVSTRCPAPQVLHFSHSFAPFVLENVPSSQGLHDLPSVPYFPAKHNEHDKVRRGADARCC